MPRFCLPMLPSFLVPLLLGGLTGILLGCTSDQPSRSSATLHFEETLRIGSDDPDTRDVPTLRRLSWKP